MTKTEITHSLTIKFCVSWAVLGAGDTEGSGIDMVIPFRELTFWWKKNMRINDCKLWQDLWRQKKKKNWVMEALDVWINVARDDVGKIEWNHISFLLEHNFTYWTSENIEFYWANYDNKMEYRIFKN